MQKKIYSLFLAPCLLALCFLMSCGGGDDNNPITTPTPRPPGPVVPPVTKPDPKVVIDQTPGNEPQAIVFGGKIKVTGRVDLSYQDNSIRISNIEITLANTGTGVSKSIPLNKPGSDFGDGFAFQDGQPDGLDFNQNTCEYSKGTVKISIRVYISTQPTIPAAGYDFEYENTPEGCQDRTLTLTVNPTECTVTRNPPGPTYKDGDNVTLTANPCATYEFQNWTDGGITEGSENPKTIRINGNRSLQANYVKNYTLVKDAVNSKDYMRDQIIMGYVKYTGSDLEAQGSSTRITQWFKKEDGSRDQIGWDPVALGPLPNNPSTAQFTPAEGNCPDGPCEATEIGFTVNYYFLVKTTSSGGWPTWYLMHGANCANAPVGQKCTAITVWKVQ